MKDMGINKRGLVQVYTGNGKGKTTAAWGLALRAVGRGWKVSVVQFLKPAASGERIAAKQIKPWIGVYGYTSPYDPCIDQHESAELRRESRKNFEKARELILSGAEDLVVLDEINIVLHYGFVSREEMLELLQDRPARTEIVLTGRYAPDWLKDAADLVTEMVDVKHPSQTGLGARKGIEF